MAQTKSDSRGDRLKVIFSRVSFATFSSWDEATRTISLIGRKINSSEERNGIATEDFPGSFLGGYVNRQIADMLLPIESGRGKTNELYQARFYQGVTIRNYLGENQTLHNYRFEVAHTRQQPLERVTQELDSIIDKLPTFIEKYAEIIKKQLHPVPDRKPSRYAQKTQGTNKPLRQFSRQLTHSFA